MSGATRRASLRRRFGAFSSAASDQAVEPKLDLFPAERAGCAVVALAGLRHVVEVVRAGEDRKSPAMNGRSESRGPGPWRGRMTCPGSSTSRLRFETTKTDPSAAGAFSIAVRSAIRATGDIARDQRPEMPGQCPAARPPGSGCRALGSDLPQPPRATARDTIAERAVGETNTSGCASSEFPAIKRPPNRLYSKQLGVKRPVL